MHHPEVEIRLLAGIGLLKNPEEVIAHLTHLKEIFKLVIGHFILIYSSLLAQGFRFRPLPARLYNVDQFINGLF